uniref:uncharacterized protein LOC120346730 isoform X2 n=1 Tax=Styela clava TaxID=7725 RepID=UPI00193ADD1E|nr:uncharacterized protein LOC120346730 isoform X2 [Styela clava]
MKISIVFILIYVFASSWSQDETVFHCSPKPGCQIAQCDPVAVRWDRPGFNIDEHLHDKEFPITCKSKHAPQSRNTADLFPLVSRNILDIGNIRSDLRKLEENFENKMEKIDGSGNDESGNKFKEQSAKINKLERNVEQQSDEMKKLKKDLVEVKKTNNNLVEELFEQKKTSDEMKKDLVQVRQTNINLIKELDRMKKTIDEISKGNCELKVGNICYFAVIRDEWDVNYDKAVEICKKRNADVGLIRDEESYNAIVNYTRRNMPKEKTWVRIWTGIKIDSMVSII